MPKPTAADAQLILQLYDLRREAEMRKARNWWLVTFWPRRPTRSSRSPPPWEPTRTPGSVKWPAIGIWHASFVIRGILNADLFLEGGSSGEMVFLFAKIQPILKERGRK